MEQWERPEARVDGLELYATRAEVEAGDINHALAALGKLLVPEVAKRLQGRLLFGIRGYQDDPRDLWEIPEVREWMQALNAKFPYWFYFMDLGPNSTLGFVAFSLCRYTKVPGGKQIPPEVLRPFMLSGVAAMKLLCKQIGESRERVGQRSEEIVKFFCPDSPSSS